jgi:pimeloyl-ACP methyl ester carboxylesterase
MNRDRRRFLGATLVTLTAGQLSTTALAQAGTTTPGQLPSVKPGTNVSFASLKQIDAGPLNVGYAEAGPASGPPVLLLHGWPYDIHTYVDVAPMLASAGHRVVVPYLRGYGTTRFLSAETLRNGQPSALALDAIALMDALKIEKAIVGGCDWGARTADIIAALWPERCKGLVAVSGYLIGRARSRCRQRPSSNGGTNITLPPNGAGRATTSTGTTLPSSSGRSRHRSGTSMTRRSSVAPGRWTIPTTSAS